jgi:hypothetical protein
MKRVTRPFASAALLASAVCAACLSAPVVKQYQKDGIRFSYYSNWKIAKDAPVNGRADAKIINVEGPNHAVIILICMPPSTTQTLEQFASALAKNRDEAIEAKLTFGGVKTAEVSKGTSRPTTGRVAGRDRAGILQEFSLDLLGQPVPHQAWYYVVEGTKYKTMVLSQVSTEKADQTRAGSELILSTLTIEGAL